MGTSGVDNYIVAQDMGTSGADFEIHCSGFSGLWSTAESIAESVLLHFPHYGHKRRRVRNPLFCIVWAMGISGNEFEIHCSAFSGFWAPGT